ncbi:MAG: ribulose bisphosphate carboxylase small subunit [Phormidesmis sp.]
MPRLSLSATPKVHQSADVHEFSYLEGDVSLAAGVVVSPGTAITAESGASVVVRKRCSLLPGVLVEGVSGPKVTGQGASDCSVFLSEQVTVAHKAIIHSPAFIGTGCFIGFRSTIYNARLGDGCVVMMHALVQDVEVPPGKCVPSGSIITSQHQADQLPDVQPDDLEFAKEIAKVATGGARNLTSKSQSFADRRAKARLVPVSGASRTSPSRSATQSFSASPHSTDPSTNYSPRNSSYDTEGANMQTQRLSPEIVQQVRQHLSQGYRIGMEHADTRRYRSGVWETCTPIKDTREQAVFEALERCLAEHSGEYVRMFGIDPQLKRRVGMVTVQRPDGKAVAASTSVSSSFSSSSNSYAPGDSGDSNGGGLTENVVDQVRNLLRGGFIIGTEHADTRRYRSNVWKSCSPIQSTNERDVLSHLEHCLAEHSGEYVRMFGIDPHAKRRVSSVTIQRADGKPVDTSGSRPVASASGSQSYGSPQSGSQGGYSQGGGSGTVAQAVNQILGQGNQVGVEVADARRYRSGIWQTAPTVQSASQLQSFLSQNSDKYVRVFGVNKAMKTRGASTTIQKPGQSVDAHSSQGQSSQDPVNANPPHYDDPAFLNRNNGSSNGYGSNGGYGNGNGAVDSEVMNQVTQLVNQGCRIAIEFADKRRFRSGIWQTGPSIDARRPADAISALSQQLAAHSGDYVRLVGVDPQAKRRVLETTIQRP